MAGSGTTGVITPVSVLYDPSGTALSVTATRLDTNTRCSDGSGNALTSIGGRLETVSRIQDSSGANLTSTANRLDTNAWCRDGSGNALTSTGGRLDTVSRIQDSSGNAISAQSGRLLTSSQMTDFQNLGINLSTDAFGRLRVSEPGTIFDSKQVFAEPVLYYTGTTASGGTSVYNSNRSSTLLSCTGAVGSTAIRQTKRYFNYQPGKSFQVFVTFVATNGGVANTVKSVGYYDVNNGLIFQLSGTTAQFVRRTNTSGAPVDNVVTQASWNVDRLDGNGPSGYTADFSKSQILFIDFEWLGVGIARMGFVIDGKLVLCHVFKNSNILDVVYMRSPNLPIRWEIVGSGSASSLEAICCSVASEGGQQVLGVTRSADRGVTGKVASNAALEQVIAIRLQASANRAPVIPSGFSLTTSTSANVYWAVVLNPAVTGAAVWTPVTSSAVEFDVNLTVQGSRVVSGGLILQSGYFSDSLNSQDNPIASILTIASDYAGTSDVLVLAAQNIAASNETFFGALRWTEPT